MPLILDEDYIKRRMNSLVQRIGCLCHPSVLDERRRIPGEIISSPKKLTIVATRRLTGSDAREQYLPTKKRDLFINYYETWIVQKDNKYYLNNMYMHLDRLEHSGSYKELLALHCDPAANNNMPHAEYKRSPHFHISGWEVIKRAHISVSLHQAEQVIAKIGLLDKIFSKASRMIEQEILELIEGSVSSVS